MKELLNFLNTKFIILLFPLLFVSSYINSQGKTDTSKINFDLNKFTEDGIEKMTGGGYINYEFCIPGNDETLKEVMSIDSTVGAYKNSKGRSACLDKEWLCIGSSHQKNFKNVLWALTKISYIRKISQTFWE